MKLSTKNVRSTSVNHSTDSKSEERGTRTKRSEEQLNEGLGQVAIGEINSLHERTHLTTHAPEVRHIGFLKVHKAASSTVQNIIFRFGFKRNLTFVFTQHPNYFSRSAQNHLPLAAPKFRHGYDILCNHGIFNYSIYSSLLPNDTVYIGIVRDPLAVFISAVNFYSQKSQALGYLARIRVKKLQKLIYQPDIFDAGFFSYTKNVMSRDFGFPISNDPNTIANKLSELDNIFKLVLIVEQFEESLVLMRRHLHWRMQDILFLPKNAYTDRGEGVSLAELNSTDIETFKKRNHLDYKVYEFFLEKSRKQFQSEPNDIQLEVSLFKKVLSNVSDFCNTRKVDDNSVLKIEASNWNEEFYVNSMDCWLMKVDELNFIRILRRKQGSAIRRPPMMRGRDRIVMLRRHGLQQNRYMMGQGREREPFIAGEGQQRVYRRAPGMFTRQFRPF